VKRRIAHLCTMLTLLLILCIGPASIAVAQTQQLVPVTVIIMRVVEVSCDEGLFVPCPDDYFAKVNIDGQGFQETGHYNQQSDVSPFWQFTRQVDRNKLLTVIKIEIWDDEDSSRNDQLDISTNDRDETLDLAVDLNTGVWSGDVQPSVGFSQGTNAKILFDISVGSDGDIDDDGIPDSVERFGVRDANGNVVTDLAAMGADPCRRTIAVEIDFMGGAADGHMHRPQAAAITEAVDAFNAAPVAAVSPCPYAGFPTQASGVNLVVDINNQIAEQPVLGLGRGFNTIKAANFDANRGPYFHYNLWVHDRAMGSSSSGVCCSGKDFIVSLGSWGPTQNGTMRQQSGTFIHELGHTLGLDHGGGDGVNCKPNYLSVMSYSFQTVGITDGATGISQIDYSRQDLNTLDEAMLDETVGIADGTLLTTWADPTQTQRGGQGNGPLDWNWSNAGDGPFTIVPPVDINALPIGDCGLDRNGNPAPSPGQDLDGFNDWANIKYRAGMSPDAGGVSTVFDEITFQEAQIVEAFWDAFLVSVVNAGSDQVADEGAIIQLDPATFIDPGITPSTHTATIDWGDGSPIEVGIVSESNGSGTISGSHAYGDDGTFIVTVCVSDDQGTGCDTLTVTVNNVVPSVNLTSDSPKDEGSLLTVSGVIADPGWLDTLSGTINWGDGLPAESIAGMLENVRPDATLIFHVAHVYADNGSYTVQVCGTDDDGATSCSSTAVGVNNVPPTVDAGQDQVIYEGDTVVLDPATFNDKGTLDTHTATINWGDGSPLDTGIVSEAPFGPPGSTEGANGTVAGQHHYRAAPGVYTVTVTVTDDDGGVGSDTLRVAVVPGFFRFCVFADGAQSASSTQRMLIMKRATLDCAEVPGGAPGGTRPGGVGSRGNMEAEDHAAVAGDMVSLKKEVILKGDSILTGNIVAERDVELEDKARATGNVTTAHDIILKNDSTIEGDATAGGSVQRSGGSRVLGAIHESADVPPIQAITSVQLSLRAGTRDVAVATNLALEPGSYKDLEVRTGATLILRSGRYAFKQFVVGREATIVFDLSSGPVVIDVVDDVAFKERARMAISSPAGAATDILFRIGGRGVQLGKDGVYLGTFLALKANAQLGQNATLTGALYGREVEVRERTSIIGKPAAQVFASLLPEAAP
jgi:hypothetical protein